MLDFLTADRNFFIAYWVVTFLLIAILGQIYLKEIKKIPGFESSDLYKLNKNKLLTPKYILKVVLLAVLLPLLLAYFIIDKEILESVFGALFAITTIYITRSLRVLIGLKYIKSIKEGYFKINSQELVRKLTALEFLGYTIIFFMLYILFPRGFFNGAFIGTLFLTIYSFWISRKN